MSNPNISVVIPVYNEAGNLDKLYARLTKVLDTTKKSYEIIFINDGSRDKSFEILKSFHHKNPKNIRVIDFSGNFGQHMAVMAGFELSKGERIITLDADLQNPPEEIPNLLAKMDAGFDLVSGIRQQRKDNFFRTYVSKVINFIREKITNICMKDHGCMLRAYSRDIVDIMIQAKEKSVFIPALAYSYANNPTEIIVKHDERSVGASKYNLYSLIRLNFNLMTGYSLMPLQAFTLFGFFVSAMSLLFVAYLFVRRIVIGPEADGVFTLLAIMFFLVGIILMGLGIVGEYIGRIYEEVRQRPRFVIRKTYGEKNE